MEKQIEKNGENNKYQPQQQKYKSVWEKKSQGNTKIQPLPNPLLHRPGWPPPSLHKGQKPWQQPITILINLWLDHSKFPFPNYIPVASLLHTDIGGGILNAFFDSLPQSPVKRKCWKCSHWVLRPVPKRVMSKGVCCTSVSGAKILWGLWASQYISHTCFVRKVDETSVIWP